VADVVLVSADGPIAMGAALHAMAAGVPVVGTPVPRVREVVEDRRTGLVAASLKPRALAARLEELLSNGALRAELTRQAREEIAARRSSAVTVDRLRTIYASGGMAAALS
jgi:glycosyltransferase involved in cell wall biosynthesis